MHEISAVLAGTWDQPAYNPATLNVNAGSSSTDDVTATTASPAATSSPTDTNDVDPRRYSKFDRTASNAGSTTDFSFSDFLDLINPLQHIPVISSAYRDVTGEKINPVSRVAGDILYGGAVGVASGILGCIGATADSVAEATGGKDKVGYMMASLFGDTKDNAKDASPTTTLLASNETSLTAPTIQTASLPEIAPPSSAAPILASATPTTLSSPILSQASSNVTLAQAASSAPLPMSGNSKAATTPSGAIQLAANDPKATALHSKLAFGGVMAPAAATQEQNMAMALNSGSHGMRIGNTIYTSPLMNGRHPLPIATASAATSPPTATAAAEVATPLATPNAALQAATSQTAVPALSAAASALPSDPTALANSLAAAMSQTSSTASSASIPTGYLGTVGSATPRGLTDDAIILKALGQYRSVAGASTSTAASRQLDIVN